MDTLTLYHGGNLPEFTGDLQHVAGAAGRFELGPGLYLTGSRATALKYQTGSRKLYAVTIRKGTLLQHAQVSLDAALAIVKQCCSVRTRVIMAADLKACAERSPLTLNHLVNLVVNHEACSGKKLILLQELLVAHGGQCDMLARYLGGPVVVVQDMALVTRIKRIHREDLVDVSSETVASFFA